MNVSLRSEMVAGIAALGITAVAITPIAQPNLLPAAQRTAAAAVQLTALANPVSAILNSIGQVNSYLLDQSTFDEAGVVWPDSFGGEYIYAPLNTGIVPDLFNQFATGPLNGLVNNFSGYAWAGIEAVLTLGSSGADSVFNIPGSVVAAVQQLIAGDPQAALAALLTGIVGPLQNGRDYALSALGYLIDNVIANVDTVISSFLPYLANGLINSVSGGATYIATSLIRTVQLVFQDLGATDFEGAWNTAVNGLLGPGGTLGNIVALTIGPGITEDVASVPTVTIPSVRAVLTSELQRLGGSVAWGDGGITNVPFSPPPAPLSAAAEGPAAVESAASADVEAAASAAVESAASAPVESAAVESAVPAAVESAVPAAVADMGEAGEGVKAAGDVDADAGTSGTSGAGLAGAADVNDASKPAKRPVRAGMRGDHALKAERSTRSAR